MAALGDFCVITHLRNRLTHKQTNQAVTDLAAAKLAPPASPA